MLLTIPPLHSHSATPCTQMTSAMKARSVNSEINSLELQTLQTKLYPLPTPILLSTAEVGTPATSNSSQIVLVTPTSAVHHPSRKAWLDLAAADHAAAAFDAWSTRSSLQTGNTSELNPLVRPFSHSAAVYPALQAVPIITDFLARKMMRSSHPALRKIWWLPQTVSLSASFLSGMHNLRFTH